MLRSELTVQFNSIYLNFFNFFEKRVQNIGRRIPNFKKQALVGGVGLAVGAGGAIALNRLTKSESESTTAKPFTPQLSSETDLPPYIIRVSPGFRPGSRTRYFDTRYQTYIPSLFRFRNEKNGTEDENTRLIYTEGTL